MKYHDRDPVRPPDTTVRERGEVFTPLGQVLRITIGTPDYRRLSWDEVWATFVDAYPGRWAVQCFPPEDRVVNEVNLYHLFVLPEWYQSVGGLDINRS